jgi:hypothetical protein
MHSVTQLSSTPAQSNAGQTRQTVTVAFMERLDLPAPNRTILHLRNGPWRVIAEFESYPESFIPSRLSRKRPTSFSGVLANQVG